MVCGACGMRSDRCQSTKQPVNAHVTVSKEHGRAGLADGRDRNTCAWAQERSGLAAEMGWSLGAVAPQSAPHGHLGFATAQAAGPGPPDAAGAARARSIGAAQGGRRATLAAPAAPAAAGASAGDAD